MDPKQLAAGKAVASIRDGMVIGLGTGSTAWWVIQQVGELCRQGMRIRAVPSSIETGRLAREWSIPLCSFAEIQQIDLAIDGADEVDGQKNLIKGGGGALMREKIVAFNSKKFIVVVDSSKKVDRLGRFPLPVEVLPFGLEATQKHLLRFCSKAVLRTKHGSRFHTDNGNCILDCHFGWIVQPEALDQQLKSIPGVLETGLFPAAMVHQVIMAYPNGDVQLY